MTTMKFLDNYLSTTAQITIADTHGYILYEGTLAHLPICRIRNTAIDHIEGLGDNNDIIIVVKEN